MSDLTARLLTEIERLESEHRVFMPMRDIVELTYLAALRKIVEMHTQTDGMGYSPDDGGQYGEMSSVCACCGTPDEYGCPWPCLEVRIVAEALGVEV